jgi:formylglycine-generating enzyme required for sulfatase activity
MRKSLQTLLLMTMVICLGAGVANAVPKEVDKTVQKTHKQTTNMKGELAKMQGATQAINRKLSSNLTVGNTEMAPVPGGCFQMSGGKPEPEVCVDSFLIGKYEVTQALWQAVMGSNPANFKNGADYPVEMVSWDDSQVFLRKLNNKTGMHFRLPTEAEWEYACRSGGNNEQYCGGNDAGSVAWYRDNSGDKTHRVGTKSPNGLGIYDMSGNVWEWCSDRYNRASSGSRRVTRGGSWDYPRGRVRFDHRDGNPTGDRRGDIGFRLALPLSQ